MPGLPPLQTAAHRPPGNRGAVSLALLAGGKASRLGGIPKGLIPHERGTVISHLMEQAATCGFSNVFLVSDDPAPYGELGIETIPDLRPGLGPLGGIEAALHHARRRSRAVLVLPCDLPLLTHREMSALLQAFFDAPGLVASAAAASPRGNGFLLQPLCSVVHNAHLATISKAIDRGVRKVRLVWEEIGLNPVVFDIPEPFFNINTPEDLDRWNRLRRNIRWDTEGHAR